MTRETAVMEQAYKACLDGADTVNSVIATHNNTNTTIVNINTNNLIIMNANTRI